ncbi:unnamed protein product [Penicillium nalgiovense]|uniref:Uncharacterized protein n=1 Tax=Penicillium nalgiovense TaxID=60175 RepID=A0A9W4IKB7_PENNA|nr:unnamed protein product [Penicillium nalgiovense]CAG7980100.1 unnamed protein product [Penicillium nalgiovense]CAG7986373.1 unnamed protein product [Penicillium nalgiovense]CAG7990832.1 unnamed protein product [Penicillium nalgiovense]CAG7991485.1 unnamed protein product [Penicillium nalgiovense]
MMMYRCWRMTKPGYPRGDIPVDIFSVLLDTSTPNISPLGPIKDEILSLFRRHNVSVHVEISNDKLCHQPTLFPIALNHPLVKAYDRVMQNLVAILKQTLGSNFNMLCPFNVGPSETKAQPTIVVFVDPWTITNWFELRLQLMSRLLPHIQADSFDIEFLPGAMSPLNGGGILFTHNVEEHEVPRMGSSIGIKGDKSAGTLGGFVTLTHGDVVRRGFLTNYQVVRPSPSQRPSASNDFLQSLDRFGSSPIRPLANRITMESPSVLDKDATAAHISERLEAMREHETELNAKVQERERLGATPNPGILEALSNTKDSIQEALLLRSVVDRMPFSLGDVQFVSGYEVRDDQVMDWALVQMSKAAEPNFFRPNFMPSVPKEYQPEKWSPSQNSAIWLGKEPLSEFGSLQDGDWCCRKGRTSGFTAGVVNGPKAYCKWKGPKVRYTPSGQEVEMHDLETQEFVIVGKTAGGNEERFCIGGGSGSFVLGESGEVKGLLCGGMEKDKWNLGLASSMPDVMASIQQKMGGSVTLSLPT